VEPSSTTRLLGGVASCCCSCAGAKPNCGQRDVPVWHVQPVAVGCGTCTLAAAATAFHSNLPEFASLAEQHLRQGDCYAERSFQVSSWKQRSVQLLLPAQHNLATSSASFLVACVPSFPSTTLTDGIHCHCLLLLLPPDCMQVTCRQHGCWCVCRF
jgi:hypothetical protein